MTNQIEFDYLIKFSLKILLNEGLESPQIKSAWEYIANCQFKVSDYSKVFSLPNKNI